MDIQSREIKLECPADGMSVWHFLYLSEFKNYRLPIYRCEKCGMQTIYPKNADYEKMYSEDYYSDNNKSDYNYKDERRTERFDAYVWDARIRNIQKYVKSGNFLDIGSSFGGFLKRAAKAGFSVQGVEVSPYSAEYAVKNGIPTVNSDFLNADLPEDHYNVITMVEVIEHLDSPTEVFRKLYSILQKDGLLLIQTADFEGRQAADAERNYHYYLPGHLYCYSRTNLTASLKKAGFKRFILYQGVDFPLRAKLLKSRGSFKSIFDYRRWFNISWYHFKSRLLKGSTSSMVLYAFK